MINLEKEIREQPAVLASVKDANFSVLEPLVAEIKSRKINYIYFAARGTSDHACIYAQYMAAILLGIPCALGTPSVVTRYGAEMHFDNALVIGVSQSGMAEDVLEILASAERSGALTAAITNNADSPVAKAAKYSLFCNAGPEVSIAATKTFTSELYLLSLLLGMWADNKDYLDGLDILPDKVADLLDYMPAEVEKIVANYKDLTGAVVLARGTLYPIALEGALKVMETNKVKMKGYPISDFHHGPLAQIHENDLAIVLASKGPGMDDAIEMLGKLDRINADVLLITNDADLAAKRTNSLCVRYGGCEYLAPYLFAVTMQLMALKLTFVKGLDPDKSEVLNKVTVTR